MALSIYLRVNVDTGAPEPTVLTIYENSITHNLASMAKACEIYPYLWRSAESSIFLAVQLTPYLKAGLAKLKLEPERFRKLEPENGMGTYQQFCDFLEELIQVTEKHWKTALFTYP